MSEIEIEQEGLRVRVGRNAPASYVSALGARAAAAARGACAGRARRAGRSDEAPGRRDVAHGRHRLSRARAGARPFVDIGSVVKAGDTLLIIEAMKTMNNIPAPRAGKVMQILIEDGRPVEYGEPLMIIE